MTKIPFSGLADELRSHILPMLSIDDLGRFACTSSTLRNVIYQEHGLWRSAAALRLHVNHPGLEGADRTGARHC